MKTFRYTVPDLPLTEKEKAGKEWEKIEFADNILCPLLPLLFLLLTISDSKWKVSTSDILLLLFLGGFLIRNLFITIKNESRTRRGIQPEINRPPCA